MKLTTIVGSMFSGKSTLLLKKIREAKRVPSFFVLAFKPVIDDRYSEDHIATHDQDLEDCIPVRTSEEILEHYWASVLKARSRKIIVFIDEAQFFDEGIVSVVQKIVNCGDEVICAGLNMDRFGQPFGYVPHLMAISDEIILLKTKCKCGDDSYISYCSESGEQILVGAQQYEPLCRNCWLEKRARQKLKQQ